MQESFLCESCPSPGSDCEGEYASKRIIISGKRAQDLLPSGAPVLDFQYLRYAYRKSSVSDLQGCTTRKGRVMRNTGPTQGKRAKLVERSGHLCERCGYVFADEVHHRSSRRMGGTRRPEINELTNLMHLCSPCHRRVTEHPEEACKWGWSVRGWMDPEQMPVMMPRRGGWVWLDDDGDTHPVTESELEDMELPQLRSAS